MTFGLDSALCLHVCVFIPAAFHMAVHVCKMQLSMCVMYGSEIVILSYEWVVLRVVYSVFFVKSKYIFSWVQSNPDRWQTVSCRLSPSVKQGSLCFSLLRPTSSENPISMYIWSNRSCSSEKGFNNGDLK